MYALTTNQTAHQNKILFSKSAIETQDQLLYLLMRLDLEFIESRTPFLTLV